MHFFIDFIRSRLSSRWQQNSSGWITGDCPVCVQMGQPRPDQKGRGGFQIYDDEWGYHCFNCKLATRWSPGHLLNYKQRVLLQGLGCTEQDIQRVNIELMREHETAQLLNPLPELPPPFRPDWKEIELPEQSQYLDQLEEVSDNATEMLKMIQDRNLVHWHDWALSNKLKYRRRAILPYRKDGRLVGWTARYTGPLRSGVEKYLVQRPKGFVFNLDRQTDDRQFVVVTEGDFDAITLDGVSLGSNSLSNEQASLIRELRRQVILLPDADRAGSALIEPAIREGWSVSFPEWMEHHKDANSAAQEYGRIFTLNSVIAAAERGPSKIRVLAKKYLK